MLREKNLCSELGEIGEGKPTMNEKRGRVQTIQNNLKERRSVSEGEMRGPTLSKGTGGFCRKAELVEGVLRLR